MLFPREAPPTAAGLDLTPVIDMVFLLLIFFLAATSFQQIEREMNIALPEASASGPISAALREIIINVAEEGHVIVSGERISDDSLGELLRAAVARNPRQKVSVRGDRATAYANVVRVLDLCRAAGIDQPFIETTPPATTG